MALAHGAEGRVDRAPSSTVVQRKLQYRVPANQITTTYNPRSLYDCSRFCLIIVTECCGLASLRLPFPGFAAGKHELVRVEHSCTCAVGRRRGLLMEELRSVSHTSCQHVRVGSLCLRVGMADSGPGLTPSISLGSQKRRAQQHYVLEALKILHVSVSEHGHH